MISPVVSYSFYLFWFHVELFWLEITAPVCQFCSHEVELEFEVEHLGSDLSCKTSGVGNEVIFQKTTRGMVTNNWGEKVGRESAYLADSFSWNHAVQFCVAERGGEGGWRRGKIHIYIYIYTKIRKTRFTFKTIKMAILFDAYKRPVSFIITMNGKVSAIQQYYL